MKSEKVLKYIIKLFWVFIIGSIIGYCVEMVVALVQTGNFESRQGLLYGPFAQVYGLGAMAYFIVVPKLGNAKKVFIFTMIIGGVVEYLCSYIQEACFGTVSWDYSNLLFNINGRTSLLHCLYWGTFGVIFLKVVYDRVNNLDKYIPKIKFKTVTAVLAIFMVFNITISGLAANRQKERIQNIAAQDSIDVFLDTYYPDHIMNNVYANKIVKI